MSKELSSNRFITIRTVSHITALGKTTIYKLIRSGEFRPTKIGRKTVFSEAEILEWVEAKLAQRGDA